MNNQSALASRSDQANWLAQVTLLDTELLTKIYIPVPAQVNKKVVRRLDLKHIEVIDLKHLKEITEQNY
jgi:hypothetical protein